MHYIALYISDKELEKLQKAKIISRDSLYDTMQKILKSWGPVYESVKYLEKHKKL